MPTTYYTEEDIEEIKLTLKDEFEVKGRMRLIRELYDLSIQNKETLIRAKEYHIKHIMYLNEQEELNQKSTREDVLFIKFVNGCIDQLTKSAQLKARKNKKTKPTKKRKK